MELRKMENITLMQDYKRDTYIRQSFGLFGKGRG